ncbi:glycosyltransferase [Symbiopectobacterium purcellii]|uniref:glycosyltransferase n=1 Tax=Symbiopectobacterium purcellii TaxID=2871826 RepID=UPI003F85F779
MKLSIISINYNNKDGLRKTINSVLSQSARINVDYEYIIVDGGSSDGGHDLFLDLPAKIISERDEGISDAFNKGINSAFGDYILMLNSGDVFFDSYVVERFIQAVVGNIFDSDIIVGSVFIENSHKKIGVNKKGLIYPDTIPHQGAFVNRKIYKEILYSLGFKIRMDYDFFSKVIKSKKNYTIKIYNFNVAIYEIGGASMQMKNRYLFYWEAACVDLRDKNITFFKNFLKAIVFYLSNMKTRGNNDI